MARVSSIIIYPDRDQPGQTLETSYVSPEGLDGDRRKKSPVHLVAVENYIDFHPRANLVVDIGTDELHGLVGHRLRIGNTELEVTGLAGDCPGVYAEVALAGDVSVGDEVLVGVPPQ
ncbi:MAG TPA: hypothetical protein VIG79_11265 [Lapillicoccus sp.]|jgi:hypothetical protein|uniref:hypothetical protein n=1 Tax=Lapillicoccus sp. TaxID=1909287 RepID=UPI002F933C6C